MASITVTIKVNDEDTSSEPRRVLVAATSHSYEKGFVSKAVMRALFGFELSRGHIARQIFREASKSLRECGEEYHEALSHNKPGLYFAVISEKGIIVRLHKDMRWEIDGKMYTYDDLYGDDETRKSELESVSIYELLQADES